MWTFSLILVALLTVLATGQYRYRHLWTPLQRFYLSSYLRSEFLSGLAIKEGHYRRLDVVSRTCTRLALDEEVQPVTTATNEIAFVLSDAGLRAGDIRLVWQDEACPNAHLHDFLNEWIYRHQTLADLAWPALWSGLVVFGLGLVMAIPKDLARARARRHGQRLKGPELVSIRQFNRRTHGHGIGLMQAPTIISRLSGRPTWLRIPRELETSHLLIMGDSGTGKSAFIRQILCQLEEQATRRSSAIPRLNTRHSSIRPRGVTSS